MQQASKIIIADDHPLFRTAMQQAVLQLLPKVQIVQAESLPELQQVVEQHSDADLVLLDLNMPGAHGFSGLVFLRSHYPEIPVVVVSASEDVSIMCQAIDHEASGYIPKSSSLDIISQAIGMVLEVVFYLQEAAKRSHHQPTKQAKDQPIGWASLRPNN